MQLSQIVIGGPCKIVDPLGTIYTIGNVVLDPVPVYRDVESSVGGKIDKVLVDLTWSVKFTPMSVWTSAFRAVLVPSAYYNFSFAGTRMVGNSNRSVSIVGADGAGVTLTRAKTTKMASLYMGLGKELWGDCEITAFIGEGKELDDADAFLVENATALTVGDFPTSHQEAQCLAAWGAVTGWDTVYAEGGFQLTHELETTPVKQGNVTVDMKIQSYRAGVAFIPQQPTTAELLAGLNAVIGSRRSANAHDLVVTGTGITVTAHKLAVEKAPLNWDSVANRHGEIMMMTAMTGPGTRLTLA